MSYSRKGYSEAVYRQSTESFIRCLENAFRAFGGVPLTLCTDNLKAAVIRADWHDPDLNPKIEAFCRHYGTSIVPTRPYTPRHKGKVESDVKYVKNNALKNRTFKSLKEHNDFLVHWEGDIADHRIHGTTRKQVKARFVEQEKDALKALPDSLFPCFEEGQRSVHRDSYVAVQRAYYEVPQEYIGRQVWVRWDSRVVRIYNQRMEQIGMHARLPPGQFTATLGAGGGHGSIEQSMAFWQKRALRMGPHCGAWAEAVLERRGPLGMRVLHGLSAMSRKFDRRSIDEACQRALRHGLFRLKDLRRFLSQTSEQDTFEFLQEHPLIRDIAEYGAILEHLYPDYPNASLKP